MSRFPGPTELLAWRDGIPNIADRSSPASVWFATRMFEDLGVVESANLPPQTLGSRFEKTVTRWLRTELPRIAPGRQWSVGSSVVTMFEQYAHLARLEEIMAGSTDGSFLRSQIGVDYLIKPDVTIGISGEKDLPFLHAAISCKWTIRSDRVQNIRHEGIVLTRHRRGRQPHIVTVTFEPLPSRLASIARGTGEVDCVYHASLDQLWAAVSVGGFASELDILQELVAQDRLRPLEVLPQVIASF